MKIILLVFVFIVTFFIGFPKDKIYILGINNLLKYNIDLVSKEKNINMFGIDLQQNSVYLEKSKIANIKEIDIGFFSVDMSDVYFTGSFSQVVPKITNLSLSLGLSEVLYISGDFGKVVANIDISNKKIIFKAYMTEDVYAQYRNTFALFKKVANTKGEYVYEFFI